MHNIENFLLYYDLVKTGHFGNLIGGKILFQFSRKCANKKTKINVKFGVNIRILFDGKE